MYIYVFPSAAAAAAAATESLPAAAEGGLPGGRAPRRRVGKPGGRVVVLPAAPGREL